MIFRDLLRSERPLCDLGGARTLDPLIKSQLLYQLSYGVIFAEVSPSIAVQSYALFLNPPNFFGSFFDVFLMKK